MNQHLPPYARRLGASGVVAALLLLAGCGGGGDDGNNGWTCVGGCASEGITAVDNEQRAKRLGAAIGDTAVSSIPSGTYTGKVVNGLSGTATYSGHALSSSGSCGTSCTSRSRSVDVTVTFANYRVKYGSDAEITLTGTVVVQDDTASRQSGQTYSSSGSQTVQGSGIAALHAITQAGGQVWGEQDTVALALTSSTSGTGTWSGALQGANGQAYSF